MTPVHFLPLLTLLVLSASTLATHPPCIQSCISSNPPHSWCSADEQGRAKEECLCRGLDGPPLINCVRDCSPEDQAEFAGGLPGTCLERVFPDVLEVKGTSAREEGEDSAAPAARVNGRMGLGLTVFFIGVGMGL